MKLLKNWFTPLFTLALIFVALCPLALAAEDAMKEFPHRWVHLEKKPAGFIIMEYCEAENPTVTLASKAGKNQITIVYGQESETGTALAVNKDAGGNFSLSYQVPGGIKMQLTVQYIDASKKVAHWVGKGAPDQYAFWKDGEYFVPEQYQAEFKHIKEKHCEGGM